MLVCGSAPFQEANDSETLTMIMDCKYTFPKHISQACKRLISRMLQRRPEARANLTDIVNDPWVGNAVSEDELLPLVSRQHLTEAEHENILKKMAAGKIADVDEIVSALDLNEYNHITATYFLLAERKLRVQRNDLAKDLRNRAAIRQSARVEELAEDESKEESVKMEEASSPPKRVMGHLRNISTVTEEEDEEEDDEVDVEEPPRVLSRHNSTSSIAEVGLPKPPPPIVDVTSLRRGSKDSAIAALAISESTTAPAPFPVSSQIGTGGLSRQNSLRRSEEKTSSADERKSSIASTTASSPPESNVSSAQGSPARYKAMKKLVPTRSSPQLVLNQIHEEGSEEGKSSAVDPVDSFPSSAAGAAVIRRLEQRRRMHKARTQSCSSSDASDDDSESRLRKHKSRTPPYKRDSQHDDSSDSQDPGGVGTAGGNGSATSTLISKGFKGESGSSQQQQKGQSEQKTQHKQQRGAASGRRHRTLATGSARIRQSRSLNRISELHIVTDFSSEADDVSNNNSSCPSSVASIVNGVYLPKQAGSLDNEPSNGSNFDMLTRYLDSLNSATANNPNCRREDSQNSSDGEFDNENAVSRTSRSRVRHKVNLRVLEQRLNKIQEENNKGSADEEDDDVGDVGEEDDEDEAVISDDPSTPAEDEEDDVKTKATTLMRLYDPKLFTSDLEDVSSCKSFDHHLSKAKRNRHRSTGSSRIQPTTACHRKSGRPLLRAHSCGSLLGGRKDRALLAKSLAPLIWDLNRKGNNATSVAVVDPTLKLVTNPLAVLRLQDASRCCNLC